MLLALLLLACSGAVDPVDSVVDTSDTGEAIPQCCEMACVEHGGSGTLIQVPPEDAGPDWCQETADASCVDGVLYANALDEC